MGIKGTQYLSKQRETAQCFEDYHLLNKLFLFPVQSWPVDIKGNVFTDVSNIGTGQVFRRTMYLMNQEVCSYHSL